MNKCSQFDQYPCERLTEAQRVIDRLKAADDRTMDEMRRQLDAAKRENEELTTKYNDLEELFNRQVQVSIDLGASNKTLEDHIDELSYKLVRLQRKQDGDIFRVDGEVLCDVCGNPYRKHCDDLKTLDSEGRPFLKVACDGRKLKL